jgi:hypothetical protein
MKNEREPQTLQREPNDWLQECLSVSRRISDALMNNDLAALEGCLDLEGTLLAARPGSRPPDAAHAGSIAREVRSLNDRNRALIQNGFEFARTLLDAIRPPATYCALGSANTPHSEADAPLISVKC